MQTVLLTSAEHWQAGGAGQIYDPASGDGTAAHPRTPFANNQIPISRVNSVSLAILQKVNAAALANGKLTPNASLLTPANNYFTALPFTKTTDSFDIKVDYVLTDKNPPQRPLQLSESRNLPGPGVRIVPWRPGRRRRI